MILAGCSTTMQATSPAPTLQPLVIGITPALEPARPALHACSVFHPEVALIVKEVPASGPTQGTDITLRLGAPTSGIRFAAALENEQVAVILNQKNPVRSLSGGELRDLFSGRIQTWSEAGGMDQQVQVWVYPSGDDVRQVFDAAILKGKSLSSRARLAADPAAMLKGISEDPHAIGYLPHAWLDSKVTALSLDQAIENQLDQPILALSSSEPQGVLRDFLACLQNGEGKKKLQQQY